MLPAPCYPPFRPRPLRSPRGSGIQRRPAGAPMPLRFTAAAPGAEVMLWTVH